MPRTLIIVLLASLLSPMSSAQMRGGARVGTGGARFGHFRSGGFGYPFFYSDYGPESAELPPPPPNFVEKRVFEPERPTEPLLIEWNGDRFVRYTSSQIGSDKSLDYAEASPGQSMPAPATSRDLPPATLVFRDGHREQVSDYVITQGILYSRNDYPLNGSSLRSIQLSALDLSATLKTNHDTNVKFVLPAGPNEVVTRP
jgi:hypothetical protein